MFDRRPDDADPHVAGVILGVGIDLVDVDRFRRSLARTPRMQTRLFTPGEQAYALQAADPAERFAARFAAKEAVMKAMGLGLGAFGFHDVEVLRAESGRPALRVVGPAEELARERRIRSWELSLTHTRTSAGAVVIAVG